MSLNIRDELIDKVCSECYDLFCFDLLIGQFFEYALFLFPVRKTVLPNAVPTTSNMQPHNPTQTTQIIHPSYTHTQTPMRSSDVAIVNTMQNQQPVMHPKNQPYSQIQTQQSNYISNSVTKNSEFSNHTNNQSHIYVNAPNPVTLSQRPLTQQWSHDNTQQNIPGHHNQAISQIHDHSSQYSAQMHPGSTGHVPYSPTLGPSSNYQNVEVIRQVQYQHQNHPQFHNTNSPQQIIVPSNHGDRNSHIVGRNKPVGTVAPNTHTTASTVQPRMIGMVYIVKTVFSY